MFLLLFNPGSKSNGLEVAEAATTDAIAGIALNDILIASPTDGLWGDDKTDEEQIGANYPELEWAMNFNGEKEVLNKREKEVLEIYMNLNKKNQHKMREIPVCKIPEILK